MAERRQTALGVARTRFVDGLPKKAREVKASLALLAGTPAEDRPRDELRRRLHALYASAQVFRIGQLADALREAIAVIDDAHSRGRGFTQDDLDEFATLAATLPALGQGSEPRGITPEKARPTKKKKKVAKGPTHPPKPQPNTRHDLTTIISVLVLDSPDWQARVQAALPAEQHELLMASDVEEALRLARSAAPDVVLADRKAALAPGANFIGRLREDPLTDFVPVVLLLPPGSPLDPIAVREAGADEALSKPFDPETLLSTVVRISETLAGPAGASTLTGDLTVEEVAERIADEVKRGLVEAAQEGKDIAIPLGDGTPLLAAAWSAIGRVRAHLAERSGGRVRFREGPQRGGPAFVSVVGDDAPDEDDPVDLADRRVLVVDDDPAVVWFFAGLLREHGAHVIEAEDGVEALEKARADRPDLVISDILMPRLDGFGLTRALERDPMLADIPVILLSWKEDFLQRMRQLKAGASGYLRKEAASGQILSAIRDALRPRARVESRLRAGGDVRGRLEDVGVPTLLGIVAENRPDARVVVRDAASLYEIDIREGDLVNLTRTASDGAFSRGEKPLVALLGATSGRYTIADAEGPARKSIDRPFADVLRDGITELAARVDSVSGKNLAKATKIEFDEEVLRAVMGASPEELERVVGPLRAGRGPRELLMSGDHEPRVLEEFLVDLARQGAIHRVTGTEGEDRIALAREARSKGLHPELTEYDEEGTLSWLPTEETTQEIMLRTEEMIAQAAQKAESGSLATASHLATLDLLSPEPAAKAAELEDDEELDEELDDEEDDEELDDEEDDEEFDDDDDEEFDDDDDDEEFDDDDDDGEFDDDDEEFDDDEADEELDHDEDEEPALRVPPGPKLVPDEEEAELAVPAPRPISTPEEAEAVARPVESGMHRVAWAAALLLLGAIGFVGFRLFVATPDSEPAPEVGPLPPADTGETTPEPPAMVEPTEDPPTQATVEPEPESDLPVPYGREEEGVGSLGIEVADGQGLVVLEPRPEATAMQVRVGEQTLDVAGNPVGVALAPGVHHLTISRGDHTDFIWVAVRAGHTRFVPPLP